MVTQTGKLVIWVYVMLNKNKSKQMTIKTHHWVSMEEATALLQECREANVTNGYFKFNEIYGEWTPDSISL